MITLDGVTGQHVAEAFNAIGKGGTVVVTGMADTETMLDVPVNLMLLTAFQKRIQGSLFGMGSPALEIRRQIDLYRVGKLKLDELVTRRYRIADVNTAVDDMLEGRNIRGVIVHEH